MALKQVIVRFNRSGNRSNDRAERSLRTINLRPMPNRSIVGGEGLSSSLRSRSAGSPNDQWQSLTRHSFALGWGVGSRGNRSGNRSGDFRGFGLSPVSGCFCGAKVIVRFNRSDALSKSERSIKTLGLGFQADERL